MYAHTPVAILQVPVGEEGGPGGLSNLLKQGEKGEDGEEKKEDDDDEEEMEGKMSDEDNIQGSLVVQEGMIVKFPLVLVAPFAAPAPMM